jgi:hypothetical protein
MQTPCLLTKCVTIRTQEISSGVTKYDAPWFVEQMNFRLLRSEAAVCLFHLHFDRENSVAVFNGY